MKSINRRKFIRISSLTTASLAVLNSSSMAALINNPSSDPVSTLQLLESAFLSPPESTRAGGYWWWFNGLVNKKGITRDLEEFKLKGIGNVLLVNSAGGLAGVPYPQGEKFLSSGWKALYRHALKEADRLGIEVGVNLSSGWCMGGPWIKPENAGRWFLQSTLNVKGPQKFSEKLPLPGGRDGYDNVFNPPGFKDYIDLPLNQLDYRDTSVVAILNPNGDQAKISGARKAVFSAKTNRKDASNFAKANDVMGPTLYPWTNEATDKPIPLNSVINLTEKVDKDGFLNWNVPEGDWTIIRTGHRMTGSKLMIAQPEADGLSIDWFDNRGVEIQFENLGNVLLEETAKANSKALKYFCDDSFEDGFPNWTPKILEKFKAFCAYDPQPYLPVLAGFIIENAEVSDRFLHDYRKTIADCMANGHYKRFAELCHEKGLKVQNESAGPSRSGTMCMDTLKNLGRSDNPMGEFWLGPKHDEPGNLDDDKPYSVSRLENGQNKVTKMVASAAHIYGKATASAEAFTSFRSWKDAPGNLKQALDRAFCEGINRIVIHTTTASRPEDGLPGYEYGAGTHFNPNVTWWEKSGAFFTYVSRCQHLLRSGKFVADVLFYNGDAAPNIVLPKHVSPDLGKGYDYDVCNEEVLLTRLSVQNNFIVLPDGMRYRVLVLPDEKRMPEAVVTKIEQLVKAGATVIGTRPSKAPGLSNYPTCDLNVKNIANKVWGKIDGKNIKFNQYGKGRVYQGESIRNVLLKDGIKPDFEYDGDGNFIDFIHRKTENEDLYFITNRLNKAVKSTCTFRIGNKQPQLWDAVTGEITKNIPYKILGNRIVIDFDFASFQSYFVIFPKVVSGVALSKNYPFPKLTDKQLLNGSWEVSFDPKWGGPDKITFDELSDWSKHTDEGIKYYSGKAVYRKTFNLDQPSKNKITYLDLGIVKDIASVKLNGKDLGIVWTSPWRVNVSECLKNTNNLLEIEVINQWPNRLIGDAALPKEKRLTNTNIVFKKTDPLMASGLLGPVRILESNS
ncbi:glycosyl hydrolase [Pedobacter paludis]|uniref:Glycosyl transferase family 2 n=1 Tax=Pedobacter paludis TaxID=2203212 RepID=A0A317EXJ3_9SPHI|nr:glycosyl hydrolase [Pedobacter paludis]PWS31534.1 glycosyl transferase family 2 [Pedobacter paludis]